MLWKLRFILKSLNSSTLIATKTELKQDYETDSKLERELLTEYRRLFSVLETKKNEPSAHV